MRNNFMHSMGYDWNDKYQLFLHPRYAPFTAEQAGAFTKDNKTSQANQITSYMREENITTKDVSDGYHTFGELYDHRAVLFSIICQSYPSWKSKLHHDDTMFEGMFIVGVNTPQGQYTYHYNMNYWSLFPTSDILEKAPEWDGHKPEDITRMFSLVEQRYYVVKGSMYWGHDQWKVKPISSYTWNEALLLAGALPNSEVIEV